MWGWAAAAAAVVAAWPHYLLHHNCAKGLAILHARTVPPVLMGVMPTIDHSTLEVRPPKRPPLAPRQEATLGEPLMLTHNATNAQGFQLSFAVSSGHLEGAEPCGGGGAQLLCTTCGESTGFLRTATWYPSRAGNATVAVGAAHMGLGTPAVTIATLELEIVGARERPDACAPS